VHSIRTTRRLYFLSYWLVSNAALLLLSLRGSFFGLLFALNAVLAIVFRRQLMKAFVATVACYHCGAEIDLAHAVWRCGCGFQRAGGHVFDRCPHCRAYTSYFPCPRCHVGLHV
jgi:hypothetical protein